MMRTPALAALAILAGLDPSPAGAQQPVAAPRPYVTYQQPYAYARPGASYHAPPRDGRAVLPSFSQRGGIGTTPFLGNTRGLGAYSVNYDAVPRSSTAYPARRGLFGRYR